MMEQLKPCPFCGELPDVYFRTKQGKSTAHDAGYICVICRKCDYEFESDTVESGVPVDRLLAVYEEVTKKWNMRADDGKEDI